MPLLLALLLSALAAPSASQVDPPSNDLLLHLLMIDGALEALHSGDLAGFFDPFLWRSNGGYPVFRAYPHLMEQVAAVVSWCTGLSGASALGLLAGFGTFLLPLHLWIGARWLGLSQIHASLAALVAATMRSTDAFGHTLGEYGFDGRGLFGQLWGGALATLALAATAAACHDRGLGLSRLSRPMRVLLASILMSLTVRTSLPSAWVLVMLCAPVAVVIGPVATLVPRLGALAATGAMAGLWSLGFLLPFGLNLPFLNTTTLHHRWMVESVGLAEVLRAIVGGSYVDGGAPGVWTLTLALTVVVVLLRGRVPAAAAVGRDGPVIGALGAALVVAVLALAGRAFWGSWVDRLPLFGRFQDHRYLLGLHILLPWLLATPIVVALQRPRWWPRVAWTVVGFAVVLQIGDLAPRWMDARRWAAEVVEAQAFIEPLRGQLVGAPLGSVAIPIADGPVAGASPSRWLLRSGVAVTGSPVGPFGFIRDLSAFAGGWDRGTGVGGTVDTEDLAALGVGAVLRPAPGGVVGQGASIGVDRWPGFDVLALDAKRDRRGGVLLVRSDLLVHADGAGLDGFGIAWYAAALHRGGQHPAIQVGPSLGVPQDRWSRVGRVVDRDPSILSALPKVPPEGLGVIDAVTPGVGTADLHATVDVVEDGAWVLFPRGWHPDWQVTVDGNAAGHTMLLPGFVGVPLNVGRHAVALKWEPAPWLVQWAVVNVMVLMVSVVVLGRAWRRSEGMGGSSSQA